MSVLQEFYDCAGPCANLGKSQLVLGGYPPALQTTCLQITGLSDCQFPIKYLGVPITASRLTKIECRGLVEKIMAKVQFWGTRNILFAGRAQLINSVVCGMFNYWASIFILPNDVLVKITQLCRNFLWGGLLI